MKRFDEPDEIIALPLLSGQVVTLGEVHVARLVHEPGWRWSEHVKPVVGTRSCEHHHQGVVLTGEFEFLTDDGLSRRIRAGEAYDVPPRHDGMVVGSEPAIAIEFAGVRGFGKPAAWERVLATLLVTDIVGSTVRAAELGDSRWKELLNRHADRVRLEFERFRGIEVTTTGDGFVAMFDGPTRAVRCAAALTLAARRDGLEIRVGVHTGEVEREAGSLKGVAMHAVTRVAQIAQPSEVLVSEAAVALVEGSDLTFEETGEHELKGLAGIEGTPARPRASTRDHSFSLDPFRLRGFRGLRDPCLPWLPVSELNGKEGVGGSSPPEGFNKSPANSPVSLPVLARSPRAGTRRVHVPDTGGHSRASATSSVALRHTSRERGSSAL